jgi:hypothetical protein
MLAQEAYTSLALGVLLLVLERLACAAVRPKPGRVRSSAAGMMLALGAIFCTVAGYFGLQPIMAAAKAGQGALSFGQLHAVSAVFYVVKTALRGVAGLARRGYSAAVFLMLVVRRRVALDLAARRDTFIAEDLDLLDRGAVVAALGKADDLHRARARLAVVAFGLFLGRNGPPQHQQLADVLYRRGAQLVGQSCASMASRAARSSENTRTLIKP